MQSGAITPYIDVAQLVLYAFWIFFAGLIYYLHRENKREGYPLESDRTNARTIVQGWPPVPAPKTYLLRDGRRVSVPRRAEAEPAPRAQPAGPWLGAPLVPEGDPLLAEVGPGSYARRADVPDTTVDGQLRLVPLRVATDSDVARQDIDPRGLPVEGADGKSAGLVVDLWVDRAEAMFRYLELELSGSSRRVLVPLTFASLGQRAVRVQALLGAQIAQVPVTKERDSVTLLEEERITAFYGAGTLYATPARQDPLI
jgi:photosynthetic reaction center H subunit